MHELLRQCLEKDSERRLPSVTDAVHEFERVEAGQPSVRIASSSARTRPSIAVLPLTNGSGNPDQEYFSEGLTESLITELAKIRALKVISRTSASRYRNSDKSISQIARELGVGALVEGSASRFGDQLRITVQLIDARTEEILWGDSYIRDLAEVLIVQSEVTLAIAEQISVELTPEEQDQFANTRQVDPEAYDAYQKGYFHWNKLTPAELDLALEYFERARRKEPALGYAGIAAVWAARQQMNFSAPSEAGPRAREAIERAIKANDALPEVQYILAMERCWMDWDWPRRSPKTGQRGDHRPGRRKWCR